MRSDKRNRAISKYNGHKGMATVAHVERNIESAYPEAAQELTGVQYGKVMSIANTSYHDGAAQATAQGEVWDYLSPNNWVAGIGRRVSDGKGGYRNEAVVEASGDIVTITTADGTVTIYRKS